MARKRGRPRTREDRSTELAATHLTTEQLTMVDRRAVAAGMSRSQFIRTLLSADEGACLECAVLEARLAGLTDSHRQHVAALNDEHARELASLRDSYEVRIASLMADGDPRIAAMRDEHRRHLAAVRGVGENVSYQAELRRLEETMFYG